MASSCTPTLSFEKRNLPEAMKLDLEEFLKSEIIGEDVDFIEKQPSNPDPKRSRPIKFTEITNEQRMAAIEEIVEHAKGACSDA